MEPCTLLKLNAFSGVCAKTVILIPIIGILLDVTQYKSMVYRLLCALLKISINILASHRGEGKILGELHEINAYLVYSPNLERKKHPKNLKHLLAVKSLRRIHHLRNVRAVKSFKTSTLNLFFKEKRTRKRQHLLKCCWCRLPCHGVC